DIGKNIVGVVLACNNFEVVDLGVMVPAEKIIRAARENDACVVGISGLITPSLDEMVHVAGEMAREGFQIPLLIGGATTSGVHTAVKIAPAYPHPVVHVPDASRAAGVMAALMNPETQDLFTEEVREKQTALRERHRMRRHQRALVPLAHARSRRPAFSWSDARLAVPAFTGLRTFQSYPIEEIAQFIDWTPFFHVWELRGRYPQILEDPRTAARAQKLLADARALLDQIVRGKLLTARGTYGFYPANSVGEDIEIYSDPSRSNVIAVVHTLRQQTEKPDGQPYYSLADFVAPKSTGLIDYLGAFAVTTGFGVERLCRAFEDEHDDYRSIMVQAVADRLAEAFAELLHKEARENWGYGLDEGLTVEDLHRERYRGIRPAPGYPACPDHSEKLALWRLLDAEAQTGITLTENFAMLPASSVCGWYFAHPEARYFAVGKLDRDQAEDYRRRKGLDLAVVERWLSPNLAYDPGSAERES
ncbi:MAG: methionine synthase, partial [Acidobacteria bacterium]|nr:methionine synthase [Acidobacteriota bacterium]